eukprot:gnl/Trimastix_PCT/2194.p1 GENE.gnl/Trimastix_PCT/2194~~gnl/Trimastix_PCT/2194.p1  ORF type:complete len:236 (+),score=25.32 gnl/Trimastix_PCT/2194:100-708(+)
MQPSEYDFLFKILLVGDAAVGKSALIIQFVNQRFSSQHINTIGVDFKIKTINIDGKRVKLQIWDTAGQERFRTITSSYYRGADGIFVVYDVTKRDTFDNVSLWLREIKRYSVPDVERLLIGNKCDLEDRRAVPFATGHEYARSIGVPFMETSAKASIDVERAFFEIARTLMRPSPKGKSGKGKGRGVVLPADRADSKRGCPC